MLTQVGDVKIPEDVEPRELSYADLIPSTSIPANLVHASVDLLSLIAPGSGVTSLLDAPLESPISLDDLVCKKTRYTT